MEFVERDIRYYWVCSFVLGNIFKIIFLITWDPQSGTLLLGMQFQSCNILKQILTSYLARIDGYPTTTGDAIILYDVVPARMCRSCNIFKTKKQQKERGQIGGCKLFFKSLKEIICVQGSDCTVHENQAQCRLDYSPHHVEQQYKASRDPTHHFENA